MLRENSLTEPLLPGGSSDEPAPRARLQTLDDEPWAAATPQEGPAPAPGTEGQAPRARIVPLDDPAGGTQQQQPGPAAQPITLYIATPAYGCMLTEQYTQCLLQTQLALGELGVGLCVDLLGNESLITRARNLLTKRFMQSGASHLLFIDADITWSPQAVVRLLQKDQPVVTGVYPKKFVDWPTLEAKQKAGSQEPVQMQGLDYNINVPSGDVQVQDGFAEVIDAATGFMLIKRDAVAQLYERYKEELYVVNDLIGAQQHLKDYIAIFECMIDPATRRALSEDFAFSRRWQSLGGKVFADLAMPLGHTGGFHFEGDFSARLARPAQGAPAEAPKEEAGPAPVPGGKRKNLLVAMIASPSQQYSLGFVLAMTRVVEALKATDSCCVQIKGFRDQNAACDHLWNVPSHDAMVMANGMLGFEPELLLDLVSTASPLEAAAYPEAGLDWGRVAAGGPEAVRTRGLSYAAEPHAAGRPVTDGKVEVAACPLGLCKVERLVLERIRSRMPPQCTWDSGKHCHWFSGGTRDDKQVTPDEMFCHWWGAGVTLNARRAVSRLGNLTFAGTVLARQQLR